MRTNPPVRTCFVINSFDIDPTGRWPISPLPNSSSTKCCSNNFYFYLPMLECTL